MISLRATIRIRPTGKMTNSPWGIKKGGQQQWKTTKHYCHHYTTTPHHNCQALSSVCPLPLKPFQKFLKIEGVICPLARLVSVGLGVSLAKPLFIYIPQLQKRPYKKHTLYTSIQAYKNTRIQEQKRVVALHNVYYTIYYKLYTQPLYNNIFIDIINAII